MLCSFLPGPLSQLLAYSTFDEGSRRGATSISGARVITCADVAGVVSEDAMLGDMQ